MVASTDDPRVAFDRARLFASACGSHFVDVGALGHIGSAAKLGLWPESLVWLGELIECNAPGFGPGRPFVPRHRCNSVADIGIGLLKADRDSH